MLMAALLLSLRRLLRMIGCDPRTKIVAGELVPRPTRVEDVDVSLPAALFSSRELASRKSPWWTSIGLNEANPPSTLVVPPA